jgi:bacterioferritin-associated ferredoxin
MIACLCAGVPETRILTAIERGACRVEDLAEICRAGQDCGACLSLLESLLAETRSLARA